MNVQHEILLEHAKSRGNDKKALKIQNTLLIFQTYYHLLQKSEQYWGPQRNFCLKFLSQGTPNQGPPNQGPPNQGPLNKSPPSQGPMSQIALPKYSPMQKIKGIAECIYKMCHFEENLYKMQIWLVRPAGPILYEWFSF